MLVNTSNCPLLSFLCVTGGMLTSVVDLAESNFLEEHADLYTSKTSGFWIGLYRNINGNYSNFYI